MLVVVFCALLKPILSKNTSRFSSSRASFQQNAVKYLCEKCGESEIGASGPQLQKSFEFLNAAKVFRG